MDSLSEPRKLLVARRTAPIEFEGMWEFPGGKVEPGEQCEEALHRELCEELGIEVELGDEVLGPDQHGWPLNSGAAMRVWLVAISSGVPAALEDHDELRWVDLDAPELTQLPWIPADFPIVWALQLLTGSRQ